MRKRKQLHYPRLDTVLMVEDSLRKRGEYSSRRSLWLALPKKTMYQTFSLILDYLEAAGKASIKNGRVSWDRKTGADVKSKARAAMESSASILKLIRQNRAATESYGVKRLGLFGSYARGEEEEGSDIDLIVDFRRGKKTFDNYMNLKFYLEKLLGNKIDLVIKEAVKPELRESVFKSVVYAT